jgi:hypothetical protein
MFAIPPRREPGGPFQQSYQLLVIRFSLYLSDADELSFAVRTQAAPADLKIPRPKLCRAAKSISVSASWLL